MNGKKNVYVVTGAGSGMGLAIAKAFKGQGAILLCGRTQSKLDALVVELEKEGAEAYGMVCDVSNRSSVEAFAKRADELGNIRVVVNAAGISPDAGDAAMVYGINMAGTANVMAAFYPYLHQGSVHVNIASVAGYMIPLNDGLKALFAKSYDEDFVAAAVEMLPNAGAAYTVGKRFAITACKEQCAKYAEKGARVLSVSPGVTETPFLGEVQEGSGAYTALQNTPLKRMAKPEEIADLVAYLCSDKAAYITGTDVIIDGGYAAAIKLNT